MKNYPDARDHLNRHMDAAATATLLGCQFIRVVCADAQDRIMRNRD